MFTPQQWAQLTQGSLVRSPRLVKLDSLVKRFSESFPPGNRDGQFLCFHLLSKMWETVDEYLAEDRGGSRRKPVLMLGNLLLEIMKPREAPVVLSRINKHL